MKKCLKSPLTSFAAPIAMISSSGTEFRSVAFGRKSQIAFFTTGGFAPPPQIISCQKQDTLLNNFPVLLSPVNSSYQVSGWYSLYMNSSNQACKWYSLYGYLTLKSTDLKFKHVFSRTQSFLVQARFPALSVVYIQRPLQK